MSQEKDQVIKLVNRKGQELDVALNENQDLKSQIQNLRRVESQYRDLQVIFFNNLVKIQKHGIQIQWKW